TKKSSLTRTKGSRRASATEKLRSETRKKAQEEKVESVRQQLEQDNPLDDISWDLKKRLSVYFALRLCYVIEPWRPKYQVEAQVAELVGVTSNRLGDWIRDYELNFEFAESKRGKHTKAFSPMYDESFDTFRQQLVSFIKKNSVGEPGKPNFTVNKIKDWVNSELQLEGEDCYSERTVCRWLHFLGFQLLTVKKTLYV
ncbi:hypothetical protein FOL47_004825, partial [Perkinsus chesapeaki]